MNLKNYERSTLIIGLNNPIINSINNNTDAVIDEALKELNIEGASLSDGQGYWKGSKENNKTLVIINNFTSNEHFYALIDALYIRLKKALDQEEITIIIDQVLCNL